MIFHLIGGHPLPRLVVLAVRDDHREDRDDGNVGHVEVDSEDVVGQ